MDPRTVQWIRMRKYLILGHRQVHGGGRGRGSRVAAVDQTGCGRLWMLHRGDMLLFTGGRWGGAAAGAGGPVKLHSIRV